MKSTYARNLKRQHSDVCAVHIYISRIVHSGYRTIYDDTRRTRFFEDFLNSSRTFKIRVFRYTNKSDHRGLDTIYNNNNDETMIIIITFYYIIYKYNNNII